MKLAKRVLVGLLLLLAVAGIAGVLLLDSLAKQAIERAGSHALGVATELDSASIGFFSGRFELNRLRIANPPGYPQPDFFSLRSAALELPLSSLRNERITVPLLSLEGIALDLERNERGTNYGIILDNLARFESGSAPAPESEPGGGKVFVLQRLVIRDVHASIDLLPVGGEATKVSLSIPEIVVEDLGSQMTVSQICALVIKALLNAAIQSGAGVLPAELLEDLRGRLGDLKDVAAELSTQTLDEAQAGLDEAAKNIGGEAGKALQEAGNELGGKLEGLLKKKN